MEYLWVFILGIVIYNFIFPLMESIFGFISYKFALYRARDELKVKELELDFMKKTEERTTQDSHVIGFDTGMEYPEDYDLDDDE
jgi:hypothetical protein